MSAKTKSKRASPGCYTQGMCIELAQSDPQQVCITGFFNAK